MEIIYLQEALDDLKFGKPEGLKYHHSGKWSRRITEQDRIIYEVDNEKIFIYSMRGHYEK